MGNNMANQQDGAVTHVFIMIYALIAFLNKVIILIFCDAEEKDFTLISFVQYLNIIFISSVCSKNHRLVKRKEAYYYNCGKCDRYFICQPLVGCYRCKEYFCFDCKNTDLPTFCWIFTILNSFRPFSSKFIHFHPLSSFFIYF